MTTTYPKTLFAAALSIALALISVPAAHAGCGCSKLPPELASVRPHATSPGSNVTVFHPAIQAGATYDVTFASGTTASSATVQGIGVLRRDLADGVEKPQLVVPLPAIALGPASISVTQAGSPTPLLALDDALLTVIPTPIALPETVGAWTFPDFQAAVSRSGAVYFGLDLTGMTKPRVFEAQLQGYALRFGAQDVVFYNSQGFLMQRLEAGMPGLFAIQNASSSSNSDILRYSRHEFATYFLQHDERESHAVDPTDGDWHLDGTPHIDHDHLVVAIVGALDGGATPVPGATPAFDLVIETQSLFHYGVVGVDAVELYGQTEVHSYNSKLSDDKDKGHGNVRSNGLVSISKRVFVDGTVTASATDISPQATVSGGVVLTAEPVEYLPVDVPSGLTDLGSLTILRHDEVTLTPGSYLVSDLFLENGTLVIDNAEGPVTIYVTGEVELNGDDLSVVSDDPERFALYVAGAGPVSLNGSAYFYGLVYAPDAPLHFYGSGNFRGAFVGRTVDANQRADIMYDTALCGDGL